MWFETDINIDKQLNSDRLCVAFQGLKFMPLLIQKGRGNILKELRYGIFLLVKVNEIQRLYYCTRADNKAIRTVKNWWNTRLGWIICMNYKETRDFMAIFET